MMSHAGEPFFFNYVLQDVKKVKKAVEAHRFVKRLDSHMFCNNRS
jgi:hypothetical protein